MKPRTIKHCPKCELDGHKGKYHPAMKKLYIRKGKDAHFIAIGHYCENCGHSIIDNQK